MNNTNKHRIIFFGTPDFVIPIVQKLNDFHTVVGVVTTSDQIVGRKKVLTPTPVKQWAETHGVKNIFTPTEFTIDMVTQLQELKPDLFIVAAYGKIIPQKIIDIPRFGSLNIHPSLLPLYRGPSPIQTTLLHGDTNTGISIIKMDEKMDHGPIIYQETIQLRDTDTFQSLHYDLFKKSADVLPEVIKKYVDGTLVPREQEHENATFCKIITKEDGFFDSKNPPDFALLERMIRAFYPWPTAWTKWQIAENKWQIVKFLPDNMIQLEGGKPMKIKDLLNGHPELRQSIEDLGFRI